ncbi:hypothetical protein [Paraglaciecola mesophila]|nr:hypothetical protein [Paraglaciecola mesophila]
MPSRSLVSATMLKYTVVLVLLLSFAGKFPVEGHDTFHQANAEHQCAVCLVMDDVDDAWSFFSPSLPHLSITHYAIDLLLPQVIAQCSKAAGNRDPPSLHYSFN